MNLRAALPGLALGVSGLLAGAASLALDVPVLAVVAGMLALVAGIVATRSARRCRELASVQALMADELRNLRAVASSTPATGNEDRDGMAAIGGSAPAHLHPAGTDTDTDAEHLVDRTTGLFSETFFRVALESRIAAARRHLRPVALVLIEVVRGLPEGQPEVVAANVVSPTIRGTLREADTACRLRNGQFVLLLEDTSETGAIMAVERVRRRLAQHHPGLTVWAGIACYPAHAFTAPEITEAAEEAVIAAKEWRQDRIEVAVASD